MQAIPPQFGAIYKFLTPEKPRKDNIYPKGDYFPLTPYGFIKHSLNRAYTEYGLSGPELKECLLVMMESVEDTIQSAFKRIGPDYSLSQFFNEHFRNIPKGRIKTLIPMREKAEELINNAIQNKTVIEVRYSQGKLYDAEGNLIELDTIA